MMIKLDLETMTIADKLQVIETVWDDLIRSSEHVTSPAWHGDVLRARKLRVQDGKSRYSDWDDAKRRIREQTQ
jgi:hypothetical protein